MLLCLVGRCCCLYVWLASHPLPSGSGDPTRHAPAGEALAVVARGRLAANVHFVDERYMGEGRPAYGKLGVIEHEVWVRRRTRSSRFEFGQPVRLSGSWGELGSKEGKGTQPIFSPTYTNHSPATHPPPTPANRTPHHTAPCRTAHAGVPRISMPFFCRPRPAAVIAPPPAAVAAAMEVLGLTQPPSPPLQPSPLQPSPLLQPSLPQQPSPLQPTVAAAAAAGGPGVQPASIRASGRGGGGGGAGGHSDGGGSSGPGAGKDNASHVPHSFSSHLRNPCPAAAAATGGGDGGDGCSRGGGGGVAAAGWHGHGEPLTQARFVEEVLFVRRPWGRARKDMQGTFDY